VIGVTLEHPHGQIYAYPFVPIIPARELANGAAYQERTGRCLFCDAVRAELGDGRRVIAESPAFVAAIPFYARWPYEAHIWSRRHVGALSDFSPAEERELAAMILRVARGYDRLPGFERPFPYMMVLHQRPTDGAAHPQAHFHVEFYPPFRRPGRLKYLASAESGGGNFLNDTLPEETAAELRAAIATEEEPA
jgi:UDPglucose--hexose-1-phosphate uridylyltransferase